MAGQVTVELDTFREIFNRKIEQRTLCVADGNNSNLERGIFDRTSFVFSIIDIILFRRSTIPTIIRADLTYSLLLMGAKSKY